MILKRAFDEQYYQFYEANTLQLNFQVLTFFPSSNLDNLWQQVPQCQKSQNLRDFSEMSLISLIIGNKNVAIKFLRKNFN